MSARPRTTWTHRRIATRILGNTPVLPADLGGARLGPRRPRTHGPVFQGPPSRTLLLASGEEDELVEVDGLVAGAAVAVPTAQDGLQEQHRLRERQAGRRAFGHIRSSVTNACAHVTSAQWW